MDMKKLLRRERLTAWVQIILGCLIGGAAYPMFLNPNMIVPGGLTGIAMILNHYFGFPVGVTTMALNVPLFLLSVRTIGKIFGLRSLIAMLLFSLSIDLLPLPAVSADPLLDALYGGIILGIGLGLIMRGGATTGGTDMAASIVHKHLPFITVGMFLFSLDLLVVLAAALTIGMSEALYAMICIFVSARVIDMVMIGLTANKACFVISTQWKAIAGRVMHELNRGVTELRAVGGWSQEERPVLLCVVSRQEIVTLKDIVRETDERAFVFVTEAHEVLGEGFAKLRE